MYANSNHATAISVGGSARIEAYSVHAVGGVSGQSNITTEAGIHSSSGALADPYEDVKFPRVFRLHRAELQGPLELTIDPGVYCGGMTVNAGAVLNSQPRHLLPRRR